MRKFALGCVVGLVLLGLVVGVAAYVVWRAASPVVEQVSNVTEGLRRLGDVSAIERDLANTAPYTGPESGELTDAQVARFLRVQTAVKSALGARADAFAAKYKELSRTLPDGTVTVPSLPQVLGGLSDLSTLYLDAWRAQVEAMNTQRFSREEFSWVRSRVYQAAGLDAIRYDARDLERVIRAMTAGKEVEPPQVRLPDAPERNKALVRPYRDQVATWLGMAAFGL
jgi:hypothetical protein